MTYEPEIQRSYSNGGDVVAAWGLYTVVVLGLIAYAVAHLFA
jgi:hypothetical protein